MATGAVVGTGKQLPSFVDAAFLERILEQNVGHSIHVDGFTAELATKPGDNYCSDVFTIVVRYNGTSEIRLLAKICIVGGQISTFIDKLDAFTKEVETFRDLLATFTRIVASAGTGEDGDDSVQFGARCYYATRDPADMIVFEDLKARGYRSPDRTTGGFDFAECELVMRKIGLFHAASMVFVARGPTERELFANRYAHGLMRPGDDMENNPALRMFYNGLVKFLEVSPEWPELDRTIARKMEALKGDFTRRVIQCLSTEQAGDVRFRVLNHGDLWGNNMMFRYGGGQVREVMFVDYQLSSYGSPGLDLVYCLYNCPQFEVRETRINDLLQVYHRSLCMGLQAGGYRPPAPTFDDVLVEFARHEFIGFLSGVSMLPIILMERTDELELTFENLLDEEYAEKLQNIQYRGKLYRKSIIPLLERFHAKGLLD